MVKQIFNLCDEVLITATETKLSIRNLIVWLNRSKDKHLKWNRRLKKYLKYDIGVIKTFESEND